MVHNSKDRHSFQPDTARIDINLYARTRIHQRHTSSAGIVYLYRRSTSLARASFFSRKTRIARRARTTTSRSRCRMYCLCPLKQRHECTGCMRGLLVCSDDTLHVSEFRSSPVAQGIYTVMMLRLYDSDQKRSAVYWSYQKYAGLLDTTLVRVPIIL